MRRARGLALFRCPIGAALAAGSVALAKPPERAAPPSGAAAPPALAPTFLRTPGDRL